MRRPAFSRAGRRYSSVSADVAQLARATACHAEGRGFESLHPLSFEPAAAFGSVAWLRICLRRGFLLLEECRFE